MTREEKITILINQINNDPDKFRQLIRYAFSNAINNMDDDRITDIYNTLNPPPVDPGV